MQKDSGSREAVRKKKLWSTIKNFATGSVMTDYWKPYTECIPSAQHIQSKPETFTV
jgi:IS1 family transposase